MDMRMNRTSACMVIVCACTVRMYGSVGWYLNFQYIYIDPVAEWTDWCVDIKLFRTTFS